MAPETNTCETCGKKATIRIQDYKDGETEATIRGVKQKFRSTAPIGPVHYFCDSHKRMPKAVEG